MRCVRPRPLRFARWKLRWSNYCVQSCKPPRSLEIQTTAQECAGKWRVAGSGGAILDLEWRVELAATRLVSQLPRAVLDAAFNMTAGESTRLRTVSIPGEGYAVVQLARVAPGSVNALSFAERDQLTSRRASEQQQVSFSEFMLFQRNESDIVLR